MTGKAHVVRSFKRPFLWTTALICIPGFLGGALVFEDYSPFEDVANEFEGVWEYARPVLTVFLWWTVLAWVASPFAALFALIKLGPRTAAGIAAGFCVSTVVGLAYIGMVLTLADS